MGIKFGGISGGSGCGCCGVHFVLCNHAPGILVTVSGGPGPGGSGVTDSDGFVAIDIGEAGTYTVAFGSCSAVMTLRGGQSYTLGCCIKICVTFCGVRVDVGVNVADVEITAAGNTSKTDSTGCAVVLVCGAGTYAVTATPPDTIAHYKATTTSITVTSAQCTNPTIPTFNVNIEPDDAYVCPCMSPCAPPGSVPIPIKKNLVGNDGLGAIPLTWDGSAWVGTATRTWHDAIIYREPNLFCVTDHLEDVPVSICVTFQCLIGGTTGMTVEVPLSGICTAANPLPARACNTPGWGTGAFFHAGTNGGGTVSSCDPFNWSSPPTVADGAQIYGTGPRTLSVTE